MDVVNELSALVRSLAVRGRAALEAIVEQIATLFGGDRETRRRVAFSVAMIALSAKMAKADGIVTAAEVGAFRQILHVPPEELRNVLRLYDLARQDVAGYEAYAAGIARLCRGEGEEEGPCILLGDVLDGLFHIAKADGALHERELAMLGRIAAIFGLGEAEFAAVRNRHVAAPDGPHAVLGLEPTASAAEVRARYRDLVRENHPDRLAARGVPDEFLFIATERMKAINAAYAALSRPQLA